MKLIKSLDNAAAIRLSDTTRLWYVHARIDIIGLDTRSTISKHRDTPADAVYAYLAALTSLSHDRYILTTHNRRRYVWNGSEFVEVTAGSHGGPA